MARKAKRYRVINRMLVPQLAADLGLLRSGTVETAASLDLKLLKAGRKTTTESNWSLHAPALVEEVVDALRESGQLRGFRPERVGDFWNNSPDGWYVHEETIATPVALPLAAELRDELHAPTALNVWVSDPREDGARPQHEWDFVGSFLFIVQEIGAFGWPLPIYVSGISALRIICEYCTKISAPLVAGEMLALAGSDDIFGRWHEAHPIDKLKDLGGRVGVPRHIETVYKIGYMNDEQTAVVDGKRVRVNDIFAYPLYIAD